MAKNIILLGIFIFLISSFLVSALKIDIPIASTTNSTTNVNNSQYLQGYTPTTLATSFMNTYFYPLNSNPAGYYNETTLPASSGGNASFNQTLTDGIYYPKTSNPAGFYNSTTLPSQDLSAYWLRNGSSTATGNWNIGTNSFQSTNVQADTTRVFVGTKSTAGSLTSTDSVFIGEAILGGLNRAISGTRNVGIGYYGLSRLSSGNYNTAVGTEAGGSTTGAYSSFLGYRAGLYTLGTATYSAPTNGVYIGASTESAAAGQTNEIVIGYGADGKGSNTVVLGSDSITTTYLKGDVIAKNLCYSDGTNCTSSGDGSYNATYAIWAYNQSDGNTEDLTWHYNMTSPFTSWLSTFAYNYNQTITSIYSYNHTSAIETLYGKWFYNMSDGIGVVDYTNIAMLNQSNNFNQNNLTNVTYIKFNRILGACDLTINGSICSNATGTYIVG